MPNRQKLAQMGITMNEFDEFVEVGIAGEKMADIYEGQQNYDLVLRFDHPFTQTKAGIEQALIDLV